MNSKFKAISTLVVGTIGVGFLVIPYSFYTFGVIPSIIVLTLVCFLTLITNLSFADIITKEKVNHQIPGYVRYYFGNIAANITSVVTTLGLLGVLLAYSTLAAEVLGQIAIFKEIPHIFIAVSFIILSLLLMNYGINVISKFSSLSVVILFSSLLILMFFFIPNIDLSNFTLLDPQKFKFVFGVFIFAFFSLSSVPVIDELIGYDKKTYRSTVTISMVLIYLIYLIFGLTFSLSIGPSISSHFVDSITAYNPGLASLISLIILLSITTSFVLVANSIKEILNYDYKLDKNIVVIVMALLLGVFSYLKIASFEEIISSVGNFALVFQSIAILFVWFKSRQQTTIWYRFLVALSGIVLVGGILSQF